MALKDLLDPVHHCAGGVYVKELFLEKVGDGVVSHQHKYDHLSLLAKGSVLVTVDGAARTYSGRCGILIQAGKAHTIQALEDDTLWYCVHAVPSELSDAEVLTSELVDGALIQKSSE